MNRIRMNRIGLRLSRIPLRIQLRPIVSQLGHSRYPSSSCTSLLREPESLVRSNCLVGTSRGSPVSLYHELHGSNDAPHKILFITGWAGSCDNWKFQTDFFRSISAFQVCIYENRGSGHSSTPKGSGFSGYSMRDMALDASELIDYLGWKNVHVVGVSMGGMVAQELADVRPDAIQSLVLASTHAGLSLPPPQHIPWLVSTFGKIALGLAQAKDYMPKILYSQEWLSSRPSLSGWKTNFDFIQSFHSGRIESRPPLQISSAIAQLWGICRHYMSKHRLNAIGHYFSQKSIPMMVIHGTEDCLVHVRHAHHLARHLGARLVYFIGRGHALNHEDIDAFNTLLLNHFYTAIYTSTEKAKALREEVERLSGWNKFRDFMTRSVPESMGHLRKQIGETFLNEDGKIEWMKPISKK